MSSSVIKSWADAEDEIPSPEVTTNPDGTKTVISYRLNTKGQKVKITQKIREVKVKEKVHPLIAQRKNWKKYGKEKNTPPGPDTRTTQLGEKVDLKLGTSWKEIEKQEEETKAEQSAQLVSTQRIKCRTCGGDHFTSKCPFKDTLIGEANSASSTPELAEPGLSSTGKYVPRHLRKDATGNTVARDPGSRDDSNTLKVSQLNSIVDEDMLRNELFTKYGPLQRAIVVRNRETGESRGFAYVTFMSEHRAEEALRDLNGKGYHSLILHLEWPKKRK
ncbi:Piso0_001941 [Millerozyma farinosa CBS 7064]|uniref:Eukaryotic translation initiation factor 3 subunit G n=1 Tax=Pichia sorbitophila (strain ATCC MYA-4447 / BCRC 22081 / CBS 7064 / NBRC 10061 / NRRL Y-12695) TaxID=559304 RepID=G8YB97_PICSO|nr:Piso0_001941 [Millerozyma farinosa CBS 7064]